MRRYLVTACVDRYPVPQWDLSEDELREALREKPELFESATKLPEDRKVMMTGWVGMDCFLFEKLLDPTHE